MSIFAPLFCAFICTYGAFKVLKMMEINSVKEH